MCLFLIYFVMWLGALSLGIGLAIVTQWLLNL